MRYVVKVTCFYDNRYFRKGETVDFPSAVTPPAHFELIDKAPEKKPENPIEQPKVEAEEPKKDEPKKSRMAKAKAKKNG